MWAKFTFFGIFILFQGCFTYIDRGFVFQMISYYNEQFKDADTQVKISYTKSVHN